MENISMTQTTGQTYAFDLDGTNLGHGWTTADTLWNHVKNHSRPAVVNHYARPVPSIAQALRKYESNSIEAKMIGRKYYFRAIRD